MTTGVNSCAYSIGKSLHFPSLAFHPGLKMSGLPASHLKKQTIYLNTTDLVSA
jgi:hypothetical protein